MEPFKKSLLLELPIPFKMDDGRLHVEAQAFNGLRRWADNFESITVCAPLLDSSSPHLPTAVWCDFAMLATKSEVAFVPLPWSYHPIDFAKTYLSTRRLLSRLIDAHRYLCFCNIGGVGAWGSVAAHLAHARNRRYAVWFDWVVHEMPVAAQRSVLKRIKQGLMRRYTRYETLNAVRRACLGLFHGKTVFDAYAPYSRQPALVHDVHVTADDAISDASLLTKIESTRSSRPLRVGYVGRLHPMKAPLDWVAALLEAGREVGPDGIHATWLGDGPLMGDVREALSTHQGPHHIDFPGFITDRQELLSFLRGIDILLYCHVTPESPRCLLEALICATPIVGYRSAFAQELIGDRGGGAFVEIGDVDALASLVVSIYRDRDRLRELIEGAARSRGLYNDAAVFRHRSDLIKQYVS